MVESVFEMIGGEETIARLVDAFYPRVQRHPELKKLFPEDITPVRNKQYKFLTQFFGGPALYSQVYGAPMLRAKHLPHAVSPARAKDWLACMDEALTEVGITGPVRDFMWERFQKTAFHMVNCDDEVDKPDASD